MFTTLLITAVALSRSWTSNASVQERIAREGGGEHDEPLNWKKKLFARRFKQQELNNALDEAYTKPCLQRVKVKRKYSANDFPFPLAKTNKLKAECEVQNWGKKLRGLPGYGQETEQLL
jgi:hypothetical protein